MTVATSFVEVPVVWDVLFPTLQKGQRSFGDLVHLHNVGGCGLSPVLNRSFTPSRHTVSVPELPCSVSQRQCPCQRRVKITAAGPWWASLDPAGSGNLIL